MANEIVKLGRQLSGVAGGGKDYYQFLFLFPIAPPILLDNEIIVPTPSTSLPEMNDGRSSAVVLTQGELNQLDAGTLMFVLDGFPWPDSDVDQTARNRYASRTPAVVQNERDKYDDAFTGGRINANPQGGPT